MRDEYDFSGAAKNPYAKELKKQISIDISQNVNKPLFDRLCEKKKNVPFRKCGVKNDYRMWV